MSEPKHLIWSDIHLDYEDWRDDLEAEYPDLTEAERIAIMYETNSHYLDDERRNLDIQLPGAIIVIADLGLWDGRRIGYKMIDSGNIKDCLNANGDTAEWYVDKNGDMRCTTHHHDGTNHYLYRAIKPSVTDAQIERLQNRIYNRQVTRADITRVTERLGDHIGAVYGWRFPKRGKQSIQKAIAEGARQAAKANAARSAPMRGEPAHTER